MSLDYKVVVFLSVLVIALMPIGIGAYAADRGVIAVPRDMDNLSFEGYVDVIQSSVDIGATATLAAPNWREMEPRKGKFVFDGPLGGAAYSADQGLDKVYLNLQIINTVKRELPPDLMTARWDEPKMLLRFERLISEIKASGKLKPLAISIGNEVDSYFEKNPNEVGPYLAFLSGAKAVVKKHFPDIPVGVTVTFEGLKKGREGIIRRIADASEIVFITYYPVIDLKPLTFSESADHLRQILALAKGKPVVVQEMGMPSGQGLGLSEEKQAEFFTTALPLFLSAQQIQAVFVFAMYDISPKACDNFLVYYGANVWPQNYQDAFKDFLCTLGIKDNTGRAKLAYDIIQKIFYSEASRIKE